MFNWVFIELDTPVLSRGVKQKTYMGMYLTTFFTRATAWTRSLMGPHALSGVIRDASYRARDTEDVVHQVVWECVHEIHLFVIFWSWFTFTEVCWRASDVGSDFTHRFLLCPTDLQHLWATCPLNKPTAIVLTENSSAAEGSFVMLGSWKANTGRKYIIVHIYTLLRKQHFRLNSAELCWTMSPTMLCLHVPSTRGKWGSPTVLQAWRINNSCHEVTGRPRGAPAGRRDSWLP